MADDPEILRDRYRVEGPPLGEGASGVVRPGTDLQTRRPIAIKQLHPHLATDQDALRRLRSEAGAASRLRHRHVLDVEGVHVDGEQWFVVSERIDGPALSAVEGELSPAAVVALGLQVTDALVAAHDVGLVHGDLRPGNVLLGRRGAVVFDFGISAWGMMRPGETAPEVQRGAPPGVQADLFGLGVVLFRALSGRMPYPGDTPWAVMGAQQHGIPSLDGPRGLVQLVQALLHPDPARRPPDAQAVRSALSSLQKDPNRPVRIARRWLPPFRPRRGWLVHGTDPETGGPCLVAADLSQGRARRLARRLRAEGWEVRAEKEALGIRDLIWMVLLSVIVGVAVPVIGAPIGLWIGFTWRRAFARPALREVLPPVTAPVPPRQLQAGSEYVATGGLLLLFTAFFLWWWPTLAAVSFGLVILLGVGAWRAQPEDPAKTAVRGRIETLLAELRHGIETRITDADRALSLLGELQAMEADWRRGSLRADQVLDRAERLHGETYAGEQARENPAGRTLEALRRSRAELEMAGAKAGPPARG